MYDHWKVMHKFKELAEEGKVDPLRHSCGDPFYTMIGEDDDPVLVCFTCDKKVVPGVWLYDQMRAAIKENEDAGSL